MTRLDLESNQITSIAPDSFKGLTKLTRLYLHNNQITSIAPDQFKGLTKLTELDLRSNQITSIAPDSFKGLMELTWLDLESNQITSIAPDQFKGLTKLTGLSLQVTRLPYYQKMVYEPSINYSLYMAGIPSLLPSHLCPPSYYRTKVSVVKSTSFNYNACDLCTLPNVGSKTVTCWNHLGQNNTASNHPPRICPRGSYCDPITKNEYVCPAGKYNYNEGSSSSTCRDCDVGRLTQYRGRHRVNSNARREHAATQLGKWLNLACETVHQENLFRCIGHYPMRCW